MKRKVIRQGSSTLTMSLPVKWIKKNGIKPGDEIEVDEVGDVLVLGKGSARRELIAEIDIEGKDEKFIYRYIDNLYMYGYDEIRIKFGSRRQLEQIQYIVGRLLGFAIIEQKAKSCIVREVVETRAEDFDRVFKQLFFTINELAEDSLSRLKEKDWSGLIDIKERDRAIVNKLAFFCIRVLNKGGYTDPKKTTALHDLIITLENISDEYANLSEELVLLKRPVSEAATSMLSEVNGLFTAVEEIYYNFDYEALKDVHEKCRSMRLEISKAPKPVPREDFIARYHSRKIAEELLNVIDSIIVLNMIDQNSVDIQNPASKTHPELHV